jgi:hypothetical protein
MKLVDNPQVFLIAEPATDLTKLLTVFELHGAAVDLPDETCETYSLREPS